MGLKLNANSQTVLVAAAVGLGLAYLAARKAKAAAASVAASVDPTSTENLAYQGVNKVGGAITGRDDFSLGVWIYEKIHGPNG